MLCAMWMSEQATVLILTWGKRFTVQSGLQLGSELRRVTSAGRHAHTCLLTRQQVSHNINRCSNSLHEQCRSGALLQLISHVLIYELAAVCSDEEKQAIL